MRLLGLGLGLGLGLALALGLESYRRHQHDVAVIKLCLGATDQRSIFYYDGCMILWRMDDIMTDE